MQTIEASKALAAAKYQGHFVGYSVVYNDGTTRQKIAPRFYADACAALRDCRRLARVGANPVVIPSTNHPSGEMHYLEVRRAMATLRGADKRAVAK